MTAQGPGLAGRAASARVQGAPPRRPIAQHLLDQVVDYVREHEVHDLSLRQLSAAIGTSHPRLLHHFGSREQLLVEAMVEIGRRDRARFDALAQPDVALAEAARAVWAYYADPAREQDLRRFFYVVGLALQDPIALEDVLSAMASSQWLIGDEEQGTPRARARRRLALAAGRGLLLDLLAGADRDEVEAAAQELFSLLATAEELEEGRR